MSFGASPSDIIIVVTFCKALYRKCRDAGGEYDEISREVRGLHTVLRHLKYEVEAPESLLNRDHSIWGDVLRAYIREIDQKGLLDDVSPNSHTPPHTTGVNPERWLEAVRTGSSDPPASFNSFGTATDDSTVKEMVVREENMKFPQSIKTERQKPETRTEETTSGNSQRRPSPVPRLVTSSDEKDVKEIQYYNTSGSDSDTDSETSSKRPEMGLVIRTTDLLAASQALTLRPVSPSSYRSSRGSFGDDDAVRSMAQRQRKSIEYGTSPSGTGALVISVPSNGNPRTSMDSLGTSPRSNVAIKLAPDQQGNEIGPDAKWTKINRRLVSPEVLKQDGRRYEARPDFVAVLGVLSRAEIESLASRSHALRQARFQHHQRTQSTPQPPSSNDAPP
ncbi:hypothetical protein BKA65DRAFT_354794, partial [Rhexocercosporidium sp. MPI-PUGE-AT-0058]